MSIGNSPEDERPFEDASEEARPSIGRALRQARIARGLTVDDVSTATRVRIAIIHAIEADDFTPCGGDVYARGHIRTLARAVRLEQGRGGGGGRLLYTSNAAGGVVWGGVGGARLSSEKQSGVYHMRP
ncbi:helix-turn-helix domain-containing protein, partial [Streptomyces galbus]